MKRRLITAVSMAAILVIMAASLAGCGAPVKEQGSSSDQTSSTASSAESQGNSSQAQMQEATLYIGTKNSFQEFSFKYEEELKPEMLIQGIAELTGWDLSLADEVTIGKGGMTVSFAKTSALFVGPPENQKETFFMYDAQTLSQTILDSIKKTLQENFVDTEAGGDPDSLDIYYSMEGDQPLTLENINVTIPMDVPYTEFPNS